MTGSLEDEGAGVWHAQSPALRRRMAHLMAGSGPSMARDLTRIACLFYTQDRTMPNIDPASVVKFDHASGIIRTQNGQRAMMLTQEALAPLVTAAVMNGDLNAIRSLGRVLGALAASTLERDARAVELSEVASHVAAAVGLFGYGKLAIERWGDALVASVTNSPELDQGQLTMAALLGGALSELCSDKVACVPVGPKGAFLVVHSSVATAVWGWAREGASLADVLARLESAA